ncbi:hypothetical protein SAMN05216591_0416 [Pseudomonas extremaustralis]|uniref:Tail fiber protein n=3 Tax=Pseudomonas extremaustralis TaxID=359110 RepID=A0ABY0MWZ5_9PSED|nr:hypothetical protein [Pseudomonas extremaustralis]SDE62580.1 hypothetical protein SAMN05216591_0416 [Pseudomonas extremaustralis]
MTWYKTGTVAVTAGSNAVIGSGTSFIANSRVGDAFRGPDGEWYEVTNIASDTALSIAPNYQGTTLAAGGYSLAPMQGYVKDSADALRAATQVIASGVADMQDQVAAATEAAASAGQSKTVAAEQAGIASAAADASAENKNAAQLAAQQSGLSAQASAAAADRAETAKTSIIQSEQAAAASATAAEDSADRAEQATLGKADSGENNDITSLHALTSGGFDLIRQGIAPMVGATPTVAGTKGLVPVASVADRMKVLSGAGTWVPLPTGAAWGAITGLITAQADLIAELSKYQLKSDIVPANQIVAGGSFTPVAPPVLTNANNVTSVTRTSAGLFVINLPRQIKPGFKVFCSAASNSGVYFNAMQIESGGSDVATSTITLFNSPGAGSNQLIDSAAGRARFIIVGEWA